jgi:quercetin dioxygenase-like cupin family protein
MSTVATMVSPPASHHFQPYREAPLLWVLGQRVRILVVGDQTAGRFSLVEIYSPPFSEGPGPHAHDDADELFHILEGGLKITVGEQATIAHAGDTLIVPRGTLHSFGNPFVTPCRFLTQYSPAGFEQFFADAGIPVERSANPLKPPPCVPPTAEQMRMLAQRHRMRMAGVTA